nr:unnamed protein product [Callosobruchus analis]
MLNLNFAFLNGTNVLKMSNEELRKYGADLARKYERDLSAVEFCQELHVFKEQAPIKTALIPPSVLYFQFILGLDHDGFVVRAVFFTTNVECIE